MKLESFEIKDVPEPSAEKKSVHNAFYPGENAENANKAQSDWVEKGIQDVPVDKIDVSTSYVKNEADFKKVSHQDMAKGMQTLQGEIRPAVSNGADGEYFYQLDQQRGLDYAHGSQRVYEAFYGQEPIRLEKIGDRYNVTNGYHRLFVAKEMGIETIPASVIEKQ